MAANFRRKMPFTERLFRRFMLKYYGRYLITDLQLAAKAESVAYIRQHMNDALIFDDRWGLMEYAVKQRRSEGLLLEFGVEKGASVTAVANWTGLPVHGFDSFEGLPENWSGTFERKGKFGQGGRLPEVPANVTLHKGWFDQTLPAFLNAHPDEPVAFLHVDCDIYSSTVTIFRETGPRLKPGSVIVFDEYFNYPNWQRHEFRAFQEFIRDSGFSYTYLGFAQKNGHVAVKLGEKSEDAKRLAVQKLNASGA